MKKLKQILLYLDDIPAWKSILIAALVGLIIGILAGYIDTLVRDIIDQINFNNVTNRYFRN